MTFFQFPISPFVSPLHQRGRKKLSATENYAYFCKRTIREHFNFKIVRNLTANKDLLSKPNPYEQTREPKYRPKEQPPSLTSAILKPIEKHEICRLSLKLEI